MSGNGNARLARVHYLWRGDLEVPKIQLAGKWLADQGFKIGSSIEVVCERGQLIIRPVANIGTSEPIP